MNLVRPGMDPIQFVSSAESDSLQDKDLLSVTYTRVQKESPEFTIIYEGINQSVDIRISTFIFRAAPEPVLSLYDFVMTTFVPQSNNQTIKPGSTEYDVNRVHASAASGTDDKIRVLVKLARVQGWCTFCLCYRNLICRPVILIHGRANLATLSLSTADVAVLLRPKSLRVTGRLGSLALSNDSQLHTVRDEFNQILSIEGQNFAEFRYQTFDPDEDTYTGIKSSVYLNTASVKFQFLEQPLHDIYLFVVKLAKLKGLYDAATQVAVQRASEIERMQFEVSVKSPIVVFPSDPAQSRDVLVMRLGEISARNTSEAIVNKMAASLRGIQLVSQFYYEETPSVLKIIDDIDIMADIVQTSGIDRSQDNDYPDTQVLFILSQYYNGINVQCVNVHCTDCYQNLRCSIAFDADPVWTSHQLVQVSSQSFSRGSRG